MEVPYNTTIFKEMRVFGQTVAPVADWAVKRGWVNYAFSELEEAGYTIASAYTAVKDPARTRFLYRDLLWTGADMIGLGVASFSHVNGTHYQNEHDWEPYIEQGTGRNASYLARAHSQPGGAHDSRVRAPDETRTLQSEYFRQKFGVDVQQRFDPQLTRLEEQGFLERDSSTLQLSRDGLLQVDRLLHEFFCPSTAMSGIREPQQNDIAVYDIKHLSSWSDLESKLRCYCYRMRSGWFVVLRHSREQRPSRTRVGKGEISPISHW